MNDPSRLLGTRRQQLEAAGVALVMFAVTLAYEFGLARNLAPDFELNPWELIGTWLGLTSVWLARTGNIWTWPTGIVCTICLGAYFGQIAIAGQQWLNWAFFTPIGVWGWSHWAKGDRRDGLPISYLRRDARWLWAVATGLLIVAVYLAIGWFAPGSHYPALDAVVVGASVVAQVLLARKNVESWYLWAGPVNALSVTLFLLTGSYAVMALYVAYLVHAVLAIRRWQRHIEPAGQVL